MRGCERADRGVGRAAQHVGDDGAGHVQRGGMGGFALEQETLDGVVVLVFAEPGDGALQPAGLGTEDVGAPRVALVKSEPELE